MVRKRRLLDSPAAGVLVFAGFTLARRQRERHGAALGWTLGLGGAWVGLMLKLWL